MQLNHFGVLIPQGVELAEGYVELKHNTVYQVVLQNLRPVRCDASVEIDGKAIGVWRVKSQDSITLERPIHDRGQFTFYQVGTVEATVISSRLI